MKVGINLDGTLLNYGLTEFSVNYAFIARLVADGVTEVTIITNQGGLCFNEINPDKYPAPVDFLERAIVAYQVLHEAGINVYCCRVAIWHPKASEEMIDAVRTELLLLNAPQMGVSIFEHEAARKPGTQMFERLDIVRYYGDSDEDEQAAANAGIEFVRVERFMGEQEIKSC